MGTKLERSQEKDEYLMQSNSKFNLNLLDLIKAPIWELDNDYAIEPYPGKGLLHIRKCKLWYITGYIRMKAKGENKDEKNNDKKSIAGRYPENYLQFIDAVWGYEPNSIEVCSGAISSSHRFTVDINPDNKPNLVDDGQYLSKVESNKYSRWYCDPPYSVDGASRLYGTKLPEIGLLLKAGAKVVKPKSLMFLLLGGNVNIQPHPREIKRIGHISLSAMPNNENRSLHIYYKLPLVGTLDYELPQIKLEAPKNYYACTDIRDISFASGSKGGERG